MRVVDRVTFWSRNAPPWLYPHSMLPRGGSRIAADESNVAGRMRGHRIRGTALRATRAAAIRNSLGIRPARKLSGDKLPSMATEHDVEDDPELTSARNSAAPPAIAAARSSLLSIARITREPVRMSACIDPITAEGPRAIED